MNADEYLSVLNPEQKEAVIHNGKALLILAGAGSGKTRVITTKIAYLINQKGYDPHSILAVTFTKKAANEMAERASHLEESAKKTQIRTFHSFGAWFLRLYSDSAGVDPNFTVYDDDDMLTILTNAMPSLSRQQASHAVHKISLAKDYCLTPDSPDLVLIESDEDFPIMYKAYQKRLRETGNVDFGDLIMLPVLVLKSDEKIKAQIQNRFRVIMVDEYQDSNVAQFELLSQLAGEQTYVCVVGDDDQSIYSFRGAEVKNILNFQSHFPETDIIKLERNYRSFAPILSTATSVVSKNKNRLGKTLNAQRIGGKKPTLAFLPNQNEESAFCAELITQSHKMGVPYSDWAILYRTNAQSLGFETEFLHRKIPYTVVGSLKFYQREEIKDALSFLALIANPKDEVAFRRIINKPTRGIGNLTQEKIIAYSKENVSLLFKGDLVESAREFSSSATKKAKTGILDFISIFDDLKSMIKQESENQSDDQHTVKLSTFIEKLITLSGFAEYHSAQDEISGTQRLSNLQELVNSATLYNATIEGLLEFLDHIELDRSLMEDAGESIDSVTLITLHNTKGLEFSRVIITGLESGIFPRKEKVAEELEEERRLFYVGITRAKDELYITSCANRRLYGHTDYMEISPFLLELDRDGIDIIGSEPVSFKRFSKSQNKNDRSNSTSDFIEYENIELAEKWPQGQKIFHDDFGTGVITALKEIEGELVITINFETGTIKRFMPKYQAHKLEKISD